MFSNRTLAVLENYFPTDYLFNQTLKWLRPFSKYFRLTYIRSSPAEDKMLYLPAVAIVFIIFIKLVKTISLKNAKRSVGKRDVNEIKYLQDIVIETHYAACYCGSDSKLIRRCKMLLDMYPAACNIPMHQHHYTPFLRACWNGCAELISYMIRIGANVEAITDAGEGAIYLAAYCTIRKKNNDISALKILVAAGADVNAARHDGITPLELAVLKGHSRLARWLVAHGAKMSLDETN